MKFDLHVHSTFSDGELSPLELLKVCHQKNISAIAITDHNTLLGSKQLIKENSYPNIIRIPGIEFTAKSPKNINLHILGYNMDLENSTLNQISEEFTKDSIRRVKSLISELKKSYGISFKDEDIKEVFSSQGNIGRPDIARLCLKYGYVKDVKAAFKYLFNPIKDKIVKKQFDLTDKECIKYLVEAGGITSLAHPVTLKKEPEELKSYIYDLANAGLAAVEVFHSDNPPKLTHQLLQITNDLHLFQSLGSDYHGPIVKPDIELGSGRNNNLLSKNASIITKLLEGTCYEKDS